MKFATPQIFRKAMPESNIQHGYVIKYIRNANSRITVVCKHGCGWRLHASPMQGERTFQIKSFQPKHACGRSYNNHLVNSTYLAHKYMDKFRNDPNIKVGPMQKTV